VASHRIAALAHHYSLQFVGIPALRNDLYLALVAYLARRNRVSRARAFSLYALYSLPAQLLCLDSVGLVHSLARIRDVAASGCGNSCASLSPRPNDYSS